MATEILFSSQASPSKSLVILVSMVGAACTMHSKVSLLEKVSNKAKMDRSLDAWIANSEKPELRIEALEQITSCAQDTQAIDENRAYCVKLLNDLAIRSDDVLETINGLVLPTRVVKLAKVFEELDNQHASSR